VLVLNAVARPARGSTRALEHLGARLEDAAGLAASRRQLQAIAVPIEELFDTRCCSARLARVDAADSSGLRRELFVAREEILEASMVLEDLHGVLRFLLLLPNPWG